MLMCYYFYVFFFFNDTATTEIYTLSLHDALPISGPLHRRRGDPHVHLDRPGLAQHADQGALGVAADEDRKSTRLNSSHANISYAVFCLKKKKTNKKNRNNVAIIPNAT